jgi:ADP-ribosylglycohydrolase
MSHPIRNAILGVIVGDALGVPVEFKSREYLKENPVTDMTGYGTYNQPPGTWSDDSSLTLCLADQLSREFDLQNIANSFVSWLYNSHWTPHGEVFDVGQTTEAGIKNLKNGVPPEESGVNDVSANGNGSLMRILPLLFHIKDIENDLERYEIIRKVSAITHAHIRSTLSCFYYLEFARFILSGHSPAEAYHSANDQFLRLTSKLGTESNEVAQFKRLTDGKIDELEEEAIDTNTYVIYTLEAAIWIILNTNNYPEAVLKAVNLGYDTDTTAAVTGGLAGLIYKTENIPIEWLDQIPQMDAIETVIQQLRKKYNG